MTSCDWHLLLCGKKHKNTCCYVAGFVVKYRLEQRKSMDLLYIQKALLKVIWRLSKKRWCRKSPKRITPQMLVLLYITGGTPILDNTSILRKLGCSSSKCVYMTSNTSMVSRCSLPLVVKCHFLRRTELVVFLKTRL